MPTKNPRISVTLTPELAAILERLSGLTGNSKSAMVAELLETAVPVFHRMSEVLEAAETLKGHALSAKDQIIEGLDRAQGRIEEQLGLSLEQLDDGFRPLLEAAEKVSRRGARAGGSRSAGGAASGPKGRSTPVPVTRGSGTRQRSTGGEEKQVRSRVKGS